MDNFNNQLIVNELLYESKENNEKTLLENLYNLLINSPATIGPVIEKLKIAYTGEKYKDITTNLEELMFKSKNVPEMAYKTDYPSTVSRVYKMNISIFFHYELKTICDFVVWLFQRQYGWADKTESEDCDGDNDNDKNIDSTVPVDPSYEHSVKNLLINFIAWLENHDHLSYNLLLAYRNAIVSTSSSPAVRKQIVLSLFGWLKNLSSKYIIVVYKCFVVLQDIIYIAITDVWSAIRKDTASRLSLAIELFDEAMLKSVFTMFVETCEHAESTWQAVEGAVRGIDKMLGCCEWSPGSNVKSDTGQTSVCIKLGRNIFPALPAFMKEKLERVLFTLFSHQQLSVREIAGKTFSSFLDKSEYTYFIESFGKIIGYLKQDYIDNSNSSVLNFMHAYEAEGFLNTVLFLIKNIPLAHIVVTWVSYWSVLSHYLIHPASTVRQTTSLLFKYILSKHQTSVYFLKLVLQSLCSEWTTDIDRLVEPIRSESTKSKRVSVSSKKKKHELNSCWEWREGRLLAYEVIMKYLLTNHTFFSLSSMHHNNSKVKQQRVLNNSITEGQFVAGCKGLRKQLSNLQQNKVVRRKLAKSLTFSNFEIAEDVDKKIQHQRGRSLIDRAKNDNGHQRKTNDVFLMERLPCLQLERTTDLTMYNVMNNATDRQYEDEQVNKWLAAQNYESFRSIIKQIVVQTIECFVDSRWELRRMSQQLLPYVCELIRCYDYGLLEELYTECLKHPDTVLYYGGCFCLLNSLKNYIKMKKIQVDGTPGKYNEEKKAHAEQVISHFERSISFYITSVASNLEKCRHKESRAITIQLLVIYQGYVKQEESLVNETICAYFQNLYVSTADMGNIPVEQLKPMYKSTIDLLCDVQAYMQEYCEKTQVNYTVHLLPVILQSVFQSSNDACDSHILLNCSQTILRNIESPNVVNKQDFLESLSKSFVELCRIIGKEDLEMNLLQQTCNILFILRDTKLLQDFNYDIIERLVNNRIGNAEKAITDNSGKLSRNSVTPEYNRRHAGSVSEDYLSYSTTSFESLRTCEESSTSSSEDHEGDAENGEGDDLSSDWDFSSGDETEQGGPTAVSVLSNFMMQLRELGTRLV